MRSETVEYETEHGKGEVPNNDDRKDYPENPN